MAYALVIFDLDGTLAEQLLDFDVIRGEIGLPAKLPILEAIVALPADQRARAMAILDHHETTAAASCGLHDGAVEVIRELHGRGIKTALLTRNSRACAETVLGRFGLNEFMDHVATRENPPYKPHPDSILNIARRLGVGAGQTLMVGDYLHDLNAAAAAGVDCALLLTRYRKGPPKFAGQATYRLGSLREVLTLVNGN